MASGMGDPETTVARVSFSQAWRKSTILYLVITVIAVVAALTWIAHDYSDRSFVGFALVADLRDRGDIVFIGADEWAIRLRLFCGWISVPSIDSSKARRSTADGVVNSQPVDVSGATP